MVESTTGEQPHSDPGAPEPQPEAKFTQDDLNRIIDERLKRAEAAKSKAIEDALKEEREKQRIAGLEGEERIKAEYEAKIAELNKAQKERDDALAEAKRQLALTKTEAKLAGMGLPVELAANLLGEDDKATDRNIAALQKTIDDHVTKQVAAGLNHGAPRAGGKADPKSDIETEFRRLMGRPKE